MASLTVYPRSKRRRSALNAPLFHNLFNELLSTSFNELKNHTSGQYRPLVNVIEAKDNFRVEMSLPGWTKADTNINLEKNILSISGKKEVEKVEGEKYHSKGINYGTFKHSFRLPDTVDQNAITATFENGILVITLSKKEAAKELAARTIAVQ